MMLRVEHEKINVAWKFSLIYRSFQTTVLSLGQIVTITYTGAYYATEVGLFSSEEVPT